MKQKISDPIRRVDAVDKAGGYTKYLADMDFKDLLYARLIRAERSRARILNIQIPEMPEGYYFISKENIPEGGKNQIKMINTDWPVFADEEVRFYGETIGLIVGPDREQVLTYQRAVTVQYDDLEPAITIDDGLNLKGGPIFGENNIFAEYHLQKGNAADGFNKAVKIFEDIIETGYQEHAYMETQGIVGSYEDGKYVLTASCQCPFYMRKAVSDVLATDIDNIIVRQATTGGAFGGKEHFPDVIASPLVVAVHVIKKPIQIIFERSEDIQFTAKRHPSIAKFRTGIDANGDIVAMDVDIAINAGAYSSCSHIVLQRAIFSANSVYNIDNVKIRGRAVATNAFPSDAFRGFGAPQGLFASEMHMSHVARFLNQDELLFKKKYFVKQGDITVTNGIIHDDVKLPVMLDKVLEASNYNEKDSIYGLGNWKGIGISCYNHGAGFTGNGEQEIIKAKLRMKKHSNGKVELFLSNVEMGQGLQTTFPKIAANVLGLPMDFIVFKNPDTSLVPDSGPTVASRSMMVVGKLVERAALELKERWNEGPEVEVLVSYKHPEGCEWDQNTLQGDAYPAFGWGICVIEVEVDPVTYEVETKGIWAVHDVGIAIDDLIVHGQVNGGIIQALGYGSLEKLEIKNGQFYQKTFADYIIPTSMDFPMMQSDLVENPYENGPFGAKGLGELVFDGAAPAYADAVQKAINRNIQKIPVTPEYIMEKIDE